MEEEGERGDLGGQERWWKARPRAEEKETAQWLHGNSATAGREGQVLM